jgi:hypothetical protein
MKMKSNNIFKERSIRMKKIIALSIIFFGLAIMLQADDKAGEQIDWQVISSGGTTGNSTNYFLSGTVSQTAVGSGTSANYILNHGYWQDFESSGGPCDCEPGNCNGDATINIFDITYIISYLYLEGSAPVPYELCSADPNKDCTCNIFDITYIISYLYLEGPPPATCEEWLVACGQPIRK